MTLEKPSLEDARKELGDVVSDTAHSQETLILHTVVAQAQALIVIAEQLTKVNDNLVRLTGRMP